MPKTSLRAKIQLSSEDLQMLTLTSRSRTDEARRVLRSKILLMSHSGTRDFEIVKELHVETNTVRKTIKKCLTFGAAAALDDLARSGAPIEITQEEKAWIVFLACEEPKTFNYSQPTWTYTLLLDHIHKNATGKGFPNLRQLARSKLWSILNDTEIKPHKISYYLEKRDAQFEVKMQNVLCVYKEIKVELESGMKPEENKKVTISYDEKPGIQAIGNTVEDLRPEPYRHSSIGRDYEYVRHGTQSLLAGINLMTGEISATIHDTHKSIDFIEFLKVLDKRYADAEKIRLILDNHSAHASKETMKYLETRPNRYEFVFTPKHGSWLNLIEMFFSKLTRAFLRGLRVSSKEELKERLLQYIDELNQDPVIFRWRYNCLLYTS